MSHERKTARDKIKMIDCRFCLVSTINPCKHGDACRKCHKKTYCDMETKWQILKSDRWHDAPGATTKFKYFKGRGGVDAVVVWMGGEFVVGAQARKKL
jgi:hypothetical protein